MYLYNNSFVKIICWFFFKVVANIEDIVIYLQGFKNVTGITFQNTFMVESIIYNIWLKENSTNYYYFKTNTD